MIMSQICIRELHFCYDSAQRERFFDGELGEHWKKKYRRLFDKHDERLRRSQGTKKKSKNCYHFYEWLSAILIFEATGYRSLMKYDCAKHKKKHKLFERIAPREVYEFLKQDSSGCPDLFCYSPWHFCEVKGAGDKLSKKQLDRFSELHKLSGKQVCVLWLKELRL
jgi:hypothetical protein